MDETRIDTYPPCRQEPARIRFEGFLFFRARRRGIDDMTLCPSKHQSIP